MKYALVTFGCRVNQADSMAIEQTLRARRGVPTALETADVVVVNSCAVTSSAEQAARQSIRRIARHNPTARIVVTGCYATRCHDDLAALPGVSLVVPNDAKEEVDAWLTTADRFAGGEGPCGSRDPTPYLLDRTALTLRVQTGCEERCSYCIIPSTRGRSRSRPVADVVRELQRAEASGFRAVTLTGVHLGAYGLDLSPPASLGVLLEAAVSGTRDLVLRLGSLEPMDVPANLPALAATGRLAPAFHLPLQHASDRVLARMRRPYTLRAYRALVNRLRTALPHASLGADIIVGFPGETADDFATLSGYLSGSPLTQLHVFPYSERPGTEATRLPGRIAGDVVRERGRAIRAIGDTLRRRFLHTQLGSTRPALTIEDGSVAITDNGLRLTVGPGFQRNTRVLVEVIEEGVGRPIGTPAAGIAH